MTCCKCYLNESESFIDFTSNPSTSNKQSHNNGIPESHILCKRTTPEQENKKTSILFLNRLTSFSLSPHSNHGTASSSSASQTRHPSSSASGTDTPIIHPSRDSICHKKHTPRRSWCISFPSSILRVLHRQAWCAENGIPWLVMIMLGKRHSTGSLVSTASSRGSVQAGVGNTSIEVIC